MAILAPILAFFLFSLVSAAPQASPSPSSLSPSPSASNSSISLTSEETEELYKLHEELVNIPSISGDEVECAEYVSEYLEELGYYVEKLQVGTTGTFNVFAYSTALKNEGVWPEVLITSHVDTVPPFFPFERRERNGTIYHSGRGTVDAKGSVATMITATHKFLQSRSDTPRLAMLFVVSEETGGAGMQAFAAHARNQTFRAAIFGEPTEGKLASGHKGNLGLTLNVVGKAAHSAYPWLGVSAINFLADAIVALNSLEPALPAGDLLGATTLNTGRIQGGVASNVVPESANASISIRVAQSQDNAVELVRAMVAGMLSPIVQRAADAGANFTLTFANASYPAVILNTDVEGLEVAPVFYGTDIPSLPQVQKRYLFGAGSIEVSHTAGEELSQGELVRAAEAYGMILSTLFPEG
ncbi:Zn-dependent exopeptidase [Dothidotthia symphoricarpi CBS 119687]|uniref:Zn-dependent exopeptidase n=1 Tax=Dothidotthia symphoricarpi CBS 119687 TaxID=1392245 RepID=A0A6A6ARN8_9PLEO|nr:Zn-dependent exopeptidase [Dothidotthia symphoricarpi CBS 119687]KAF2133507.1 Zn-dependent exopeptidase [Dothidotthia symphoricarpi CBS 119687]